MKNDLHPMLRTEGKFKQYELTFKHESLGEVIMYFGRNSLNRSWMYWFNKSNGMWASTKKSIKTTIQNMKNENVFISSNFEHIV